MMSVIPVDIDETAIIGLVLDDLLLGNLEALSVLEMALTHRKNFRSFFRTYW